MVAAKMSASKQFTTGGRARAGAVTFSLVPTPPFRLDFAVWTLRRARRTAWTAGMERAIGGCCRWTACRWR